MHPLSGRINHPVHDSLYILTTHNQSPELFINMPHKLRVRLCPIPLRKYIGHKDQVLLPNLSQGILKGRQPVPRIHGHSMSEFRGLEVRGMV